MKSTPKRKFELLETDVLECPICSEDLTPPVYQCPSGHTACAACWEKIDRAKCPSCQKPIGNNRSIAVEKILESLRVSCKNALYGCKEMLRYSEKARHETTLCEYQPFNCLFNGCDFVGSTRSLSAYFKKKHQVRTVDYYAHFTMKPTDEYIFVRDDFRRLFVVHRQKQDLGVKFLCACFGSFPGYVSLEISVKGGPRGEPRDSYFLGSQGCNIRDGDKWKRNFLLVPESAHGLKNRGFQGKLDMEYISWNDML